MKKLIFILLFSLSLYSTGCFTYYSVRESADSLKLNDERYYKILKMFFVKGKYENVEDTDIKYFKNYGTSKKVLVYTQADTIPDQNNPSEFKINTSKKIISLDSLKSLTIERKKTDLKSVAMTSMIIIGSAAVLYIIGFSIALNSGKFHL
jgi:hypothetical protein